MMVLPLTHSRATFARTKSQRVVLARIDIEYSDIIVPIHPKGDPTGMAYHLQLQHRSHFQGDKVDKVLKVKVVGGQNIAAFYVLFRSIGQTRTPLAKRL
jgi:hypothetical protein